MKRTAVPSCAVTGSKRTESSKKKRVEESSDSTRRMYNEPPSQLFVQNNSHVAVPPSIHSDLLSLIQGHQSRVAMGRFRQLPTTETLAASLREPSRPHSHELQMLNGQLPVHTVNGGGLTEPLSTLPTGQPTKLSQGRNAPRCPVDIHSIPRSDVARSFLQDQQQQHVSELADAASLLLRQAQCVNLSVSSPGLIRTALLHQELQEREMVRLRHEIQVMQQQQQQQQQQLRRGQPMINSLATAPTRVDIASNLLPYATELWDVHQQRVNYARVLNQVARTPPAPQQQLLPLPLSYQPISTTTEPSFQRQQQGLIASVVDDAVRKMRASAAVVAAATTTAPLQISSALHMANPHSRNLLTSVPLSLPVLLGHPETDQYRLSHHQYFLRQQIEVFEASIEDTSTHTRGRNKQILLGQVGIRCKHCAHIAVSQRQKGSTYFPSTKLGIYQAAQNMSATHIQCGECRHTPDRIKVQFVLIMESRDGDNISNGGNHGTGRPYWANCASQMGLADTEHHGIRFIRNLPSDATISENDFWYTNGT